MHGLVLTQLAAYVQERLGKQGWKSLLEASELGPRRYLVGQSYPDAELMALVRAAAAQTGMSIPDLLRDFGAYLVPALVKVFRAYIDPGWRTLDLIEKTESSIHKAVRLHDPAAGPPHLQATRTGPGSVTVIYRSERRLCALAEGIAEGVAHHYGEAIEIVQTTCMHRGDPICTLDIRAIPGPVAGTVRAVTGVKRSGAG